MRAFGRHMNIAGGLAARSRTPNASATGDQARAGLSRGKGYRDELIPICERNKGARLRLGEVVAWYTQKRSEALDRAKTFPANGPDESHLATELRWLVEDCVSQSVNWGSVWNSSDAKQPNVALVGEVECRVDLADLNALWERRLRDRVPIQYILGSASWYDLELAVGPGVLIPRPETEVLLDNALEAIGRDGTRTAGPWLDLGTGSGALALGLAKHAPSRTGGRPVEVHATDRSAVALDFARRNAEKLSLMQHVTFLRSDWFVGLDARIEYAGIVSNPPYIGEQERGELQAEVGAHEPEGALFSGDGEGEGQGMADLMHIAHRAPHHLASGGFLGLETGGAHQSHQLIQLMVDMRRDDGREGKAYSSACLVKDLTGVDRFVVARAT